MPFSGMCETMSEILFLFACYGVCFGLLNDRIPLIPLLRKWSFFNEMLDCPYCTGFHCGWMVGILRIALEGQAFPLWPVLLLCWALASAAFCYLLDIGLRALESSVR
jgi:hypothetical protein